MNYTPGKGKKNTVDGNLNPSSRWQPHMRSLLQAGAQEAIRRTEQRERWERGDYDHHPMSDADWKKHQHQLEEAAKHARHFTDGVMGGGTFKKGDVGCD